MNASDSDTEQVLKQQRAQVGDLCRHGRYEQAADLAATFSDEVLLTTPGEEIADHISETRPLEAARLYGIAAEYWLEEGYAATGSGDGIWAASNRDRVWAKLAQLKDGSLGEAPGEVPPAGPVTVSAPQPKRGRGKRGKLLLFALLSLLFVFGGGWLVLAGEGWRGWLVVIFFGLCAVIFLMDKFSRRT